jgi:HlyD family secretion protein
MKIKKDQILNFFQKTFDSRRKKIFGLIGLFLIFGLLAWRVFFKKEEALELQTVPAEQGMIISSVSASGEVLSVNIISANTKASGIVSQVYVQDGDQVKKGDQILKIEPDLQGQQKQAQAWASYLSAKNTLESAKATQYSLQADMFADWDTFKELAERDEYDEDHIENRNLPEYHIPEKDWLAAEAKYINQAAIISQAQAAVNNNWLSYQLASSVITAPADGIITSLMFAEGMSIGTLDTGNTTSNQKVATIETGGLPIVSVNLSEIDVSQVKIDQKATITLDSLPEKTFTAKVVGVDRIGKITSGVAQYPAILKLDSGSNEILPNMTATAKIIITRKDNVLLVPSSAIETQGDQNFVAIPKGDQEQFVPVEIGLVSETQTEIISGLQEGDLVIANNLSSRSGENSPFGSSGFRMMRMAH